MKLQKKKPLFGRHKLLLALLQTFGGCLSKIDMQKYLFLFTEKYQENKSYEFIPYKFGCFSFSSHADMRYLKKRDLITEINEKKWKCNDRNTHYIMQLPREDYDNLLHFYDQYKNHSGDPLIRDSYIQYPYYAMNSQLASKLMTRNELQTIKNIRPNDRKSVLFTIGYEGTSFENYLNRLIKNNVKILIDVRKNPISRKYGFSKSTLRQTLKELNIEYIHMPELGIDSPKRQNLKNQATRNSLFDEYENSTLKKNPQALNTLEKIIKQYKRAAMMCFEAHHSMCHRGRIAQTMKQRPRWKYDIVHI